MLKGMKGVAAVSTMVVGMAIVAAGTAHAADKFKVTSVSCEMFWQWRHTPVINYDIVDERRADYHANPASEYFRQAAVRTVEYCDRTASKPQTPLNPPRRIRGIWFQSNDGSFKALFNLEDGSLDLGAGLTNRIGDRYVADQRAAAQHQAQLDDIAIREARDREIKAAEAKAKLEEITTREARALEVKTAEEKIARVKIDAENAREAMFFARKDLQVARLGTEVVQADFAMMDDIRTNPFHFRKLGVAVVRTQFNRMVSDKLALFGNELAPVFIHTEDVDRFTRSGETVMLAFRVIERGEVERSYGSLPEIILSAMKAEPIFGEYIGAYTCPANDCAHVFDAPPPT